MIQYIITSPCTFIVYYGKQTGNREKFMYTINVIYYGGGGSGGLTTIITPIV